MKKNPSQTKDPEFYVLHSLAKKVFPHLPEYYVRGAGPKGSNHAWTICSEVDGLIRGGESAAAIDLLMDELRNSIDERDWARADAFATLMGPTVRGAYEYLNALCKPHNCVIEVDGVKVRMTVSVCDINRDAIGWTYTLLAADEAHLVSMKPENRETFFTMVTDRAFKTVARSERKNPPLSCLTEKKALEWAEHNAA